MIRNIRLVLTLLLTVLLLGGCTFILSPDPAFPSHTTENTQKTDHPQTTPGTIEPPVTEPPVTEPPVTEPPVTTPPATEPPVEPVEVLVWHPNGAGDALEVTSEHLLSVEPADFVRLLASRGLLPQRTTVDGCTVSADGKMLTLDLSVDYASFLTGKTAAETMLSVGSVVNTFLTWTGAEKMHLTSGGAPIPSDGSLYDRDLPLFDLTKHGPVDLTAGKYVAITFDDGPHSAITFKIAEKLREMGARATFFVVGNRVYGKGAAGMQYAAITGSEIGIHGYTHTVKYSTCTDAEYAEELSLTDAVIRKYIPGPVTLMRPIGGSIMKSRISSCPYTIVNWNVDSEDWKNKSQKTPELMENNIATTLANVQAQVKNGSIILMHEIYDNSYEAFCRIMDWLYEEGYEVVTVSELLGERCVPGVRYYHG